MSAKSAQAESIGAGTRRFAKLDQPSKDIQPAAMINAFEWVPFGANPFLVVSQGTSPLPWLRTARFAEAVSFYQLRLRKDFETVSNVALCRTPQEAGAVWMGAALEAASDYAGFCSSMVSPTATDKREL